MAERSRPGRQRTERYAVQAPTLDHTQPRIVRRTAAGARSVIAANLKGQAL
jgi:hypothetical protein